jgi:hypothetical protein
MTIRGRVDVYCTDLPGPTFIAVASSTELITSGRPAVVRIVEFMATDPLYKATRIGDFGDFEFRATELHDGIMTLAQVQQLWNQTPADARWWPADPDGSIPFRSGDLIYATLGPWATSELIHALENSSDRSSPTVERVLGGLHQAVGRRPWMLIGLAAAMGAAQRYEAHELRPSDLGMRDSGVDRFVGESLKHLGSLVLEAAQQFGFDWDSFKEWFESQDANLFENTGWPPTQVPYMLDGPEFDDEFFASADYQPSSPEPSAPIDPRINNTNPMFSPERYDIYIQLAAEAGDHLEYIGKDVPLPPESARAWARLVSATVQAWHHHLADTENRIPTAYDDKRFTWDLLEAISSLPRNTWDGLSNARRICFVADLGELLMLINETTSGVISEIGATAIFDACNGNDDLLAIAIDAAYKIPFQKGRAEFDWAIQTMRERERP